MNKKILIFILTLLFLTISNSVFAATINTFSSGDTEEYIGFPPASTTVGVTLPDNAIVTWAKMDITGLDTMGSPLDIVFLVDTSGSMDEEWNILCGKINSIVTDLTNKGINVEKTIYRLSGTHPADTCSDNVISHADLDAAAGAGVDLEDNAEEAWMAGIIWASDPANASGTTHTWRNPTTKVIIPLSDETDINHKAALAPQAITAAKNNNVIVYGLWGDSLLDPDTDNYMMDISAQTQGVSCLSDPYVDPVAPETWNTKCPDVGATALVNGPTLADLIEEIIVAYASDLSVDVGNDGAIEWNWPGLFKLSDSPQTIYFDNALNNYFTSVCGSVSCNIPILVSSSSASPEGMVMLHNLVIATATVSGGLIPCGRKYDDPSTSYDERDECTICHLFLMLDLVLDFVFWVLTVPVAILLLVIGGFFYIFSTGNEARLAQAKSIIFWALAGLTLIFISWLAVAAILSIFGYIDPLGGQWDVIC